MCMPRRSYQDGCSTDLDVDIIDGRREAVADHLCHEDSKHEWHNELQCGCSLHCQHCY